MTEPSAFAQSQRLLIPNAGENLTPQQTAGNFREIQRWGNGLLATKGWTTGGTIAYSLNGTSGIGAQITKNGIYPLTAISYLFPSPSSDFTPPIRIKSQTQQNNQVSTSISFSNPLTFQLASGYYYKLFWSFVMSAPTVPSALAQSLITTQLPSFSATFQLINLPIKTADPTSYDIVFSNTIYSPSPNSWNTYSADQTYYVEQYGVTNSNLVDPNIVISNWNNPYQDQYSQYEQNYLYLFGTLTIYYIPQTQKNGNY